MIQSILNILNRFLILKVELTICFNLKFRNNSNLLLKIDFWFKFYFCQMIHNNLIKIKLFYHLLLINVLSKFTFKFKLTIVKF